MSRAATPGWLLCLALLASSLGCPGSIPDPQDFYFTPPPGSDSGTPDSGSGSGCDAPGTVFMPICGGCHHPNPGQLGQLDLISAGLNGRLVNVQSAGCGAAEILVVPGQPDASYLYLKVTSSTPPCGAGMPLGGFLDQSQTQCVASWITGLAPAVDGGS